ncbi:hypothetical protein A6748_03065 [Pseudomonas aeruginosa]|nr:hypothetical protein A6748_03065 [Pseudomonas aeruginosa]
MQRFAIRLAFFFDTFGGHFAFDSFNDLFRLQPGFVVRAKMPKPTLPMLLEATAIAVSFASTAHQTHALHKFGAVAIAMADSFA